MQVKKDISELFSIEAKFPRPNWEEIYSYVNENVAEANLNQAWQDISSVWMEKIVASLNGSYHITESDNFILICNKSDKYSNQLLAFLERTLTRILHYLESIASDEGYGKHIALVFDEYDDYYAYISYFYPEGQHSLSSGVFLSKGYGHFALPYEDLTYAESVVAHELTHACLSHLPIPSWLNEGLAVALEDEITGSYPLRMDKEKFEKHVKFWGEDEIQEFWSGESFHRSDEGNSLSYELAIYAVKALSHDYDQFCKFANEAEYKDGGEAAAQNHFGGSLGGLIEQFFGSGNWNPNPKLWESKE